MADDAETLEPSFGATVSDLIKLAQQPESGILVAQALNELNGRFIASPDPARDPFRISSLARQLEYYAIALDAQDRRGKSRGVQRHWEEICTSIDAFCRAVSDAVGTTKGAELPLCRTMSADYLSRLADHDTRKSRASLLYSTIALFLINEFELNPEILERMKEWLPTGEFSLMSDIARKRIIPLIENRTPQDVVEDVNMRRVSMGFTYRQHDHTEFDTFFDAYRGQSDNCAHFVVYRCGHNTVDSVIKSFLVIRPPRDRDYYTFAHFYRLPSIGAQRRVSTGFVLPVEEGVYLVGGQLPMSAGPQHAPFKSVEVMALSWKDLQVPEPLLGGLVLTSNYENNHITGRVALRATRLDHSDRIPGGLDKIALWDLVQNITADMTEESKLGAHFGDRTPEQQALDIIEMTSNMPPRWDVQGRFKSVEEGGKRILDTNFVNYHLSDLFGAPSNPKWVAEADPDQVFNFWAHIRMGMLGRL